LLWAASDDGLIHVSKDAGKNWNNVTPPEAPKYLMWNSVEPDPFTKGGMYAAGTLYKDGDYQPYLYKTKDYGQTWTKIVSGIENNHFTRVVRADPDRQGLLYAGTESGMYISFDDGASWKPFQLNLPLVPITDLALKDKNLIVATQGRSAWLIDDLTPLHQLSADLAGKPVHMFQPIDSYRMGRVSWGGPDNAVGEQHHNGVKLFFNIADELGDDAEVTLDIMENDGDLIRTYSNTAKEKSDMIKAKQGSNSFVWNMRYPDAEGFDQLIMWSARLTGPKAVPGDYKARLTVNGTSSETVFTIVKDPRSSSDQNDLEAQFDFLVGVRDQLTETHEAIKEMRLARQQMIDLKEKIGDDERYQEITDMADDIDKNMTGVEEELYQTKNQSRQDPLNYPIRLNNKLGHLSNVVGNGDYPPTDQAVEVKNEMTAKIKAEIQKWETIKNTEIPKLNEKVKQMNINAVNIENKSSTM
jgi:hypothetical protein